MVLQQATDPVIWGWAKSSAQVTVEIQDKTVKTTVAENGKWQLKLSTLKAGGPYTMKISSGSETITIEDILVGEVWVGSGQSNMAWSMAVTDNANAEIAKADFPKIRLFHVPNVTAKEPQENVEAKWVVCTPENIKEFSAVLYYFGKKIHETQKIPMGLIHTSWGGTPAEAWTSKEALKTIPEINFLQNQYDNAKSQKNDRIKFKKYIGAFDENKVSKTELDAILGTWDVLSGTMEWGYQVELNIKKENGKILPTLSWLDKPPTTHSYEKGVLYLSFMLPNNSPDPFSFIANFNENALVGTLSTSGKQVGELYGIKRAAGEKKPVLNSPGSQNRPSALFNAMLTPLIPYSIKGAIWYQGEGNVSRASKYHKLFSTMIKDWRSHWNQGDFPFYFVQLAPFNYGDPEGPASAELREAQFMTLKEQNTGMAVTTDIGNVDDIHPTNKLDVGNRLALWALANDYGHKDLVHSGPMYKSMKIQGDKIILSFDHIGGGLVAKDGELTDFKIAGADKKFVNATAKIEGNKVTVWSDEVKEPKAARFGWTNAATPNFFNAEGLPASTFRTDNWMPSDETSN